MKQQGCTNTHLSSMTPPPHTAAAHNYLYHTPEQQQAEMLWSCWPHNGLAPNAKHHARTCGWVGLSATAAWEFGFLFTFQER